MNVLHVCASPRPFQESVSKQLAAAFFAKLTELNPDINVINVDLYHSPPPFLNYEGYRAFWMPIKQPGYQPTAAEQKATGYAVAQAQQFRDSDIIVLSMPLWNCGMPAIMKAWFEQVMVPNLVFTLEEGAVRPSHQVRKAIVLASAGIVLKEGDPADALTPQVEAAMKYVGVTDIASAWADGQDTPQAEDRMLMAMEAVEDLAEEVAQMKF
ncbi:MAG: FMN-dependent NADH-azoreductase 1 [Verrucomicrobia bacterium ADurb.Bin345]|nr:MAG: FMN-dependent NADH-azoreductase 1 [Verrucomicrobia bacterium ADurb.Bin345]